MKIIAAVSENGVIGAGDGLPWDVPEEYQQYRDTVRGATVIFGRRSYEIFGEDLSDSRLIVVTSQPEVEGAVAADSLETALAMAELDPGEVWVAGGASLYEQAIPLASRMRLSTIKGRYEGDVYFPEWDRSRWREALCEEHDRFTLREWARA
ncbi:dihydrofolate reductase [Botrimarina sp.]|uniref:dihydrofolate reductase n=1 Tax=Botrimarina sp. TaxID=2795802 RepID=UPI0032EB71CE